MLSPEKGSEVLEEHMLLVDYIANFLHQRTETPFKDNGFSFGHVLPSLMGRKATQ